MSLKELVLGEEFSRHKWMILLPILNEKKYPYLLKFVHVNVDEEDEDVRLK